MSMIRTILKVLLLSRVVCSADKGDGGGRYSADDGSSTCGILKSTVHEPSDNDDGTDDTTFSGWGVPQDLNDALAQEQYKKTKLYMKHTVMADQAYESVREKCKFDSPLCSYWAAIGECDANPKYMKLHCAPSCGTCDQLDWNLRCQFDKGKALWNETGKVNGLMERIVREYDKVHVWSDDPWVVTIDGFLSKEDCETLIDWGHKRQFERSVDAGKVLEDGTMESIVNNGRTSTNAWCLEGCYEDTATQAVLQRLETMLDIPRLHYEYFQLLRYEVGQYYRRHHDYNRQELDRPQGNRILTVYIYLNDVPKGGGTLFQSLGVEVTPKQGRILIWPNVKDNDPLKMDGRTMHEALPVEEGVKYGANIWIHQRDFVDAFAKNCM